jgi:Cu/Ag efflux protein CusF
MAQRDGLHRVSDDAAALPWATAEVRRIDKGAGKVALKHGEIKNLDMPPMRMVFQLKVPSQLDALQVGQKVRFQALQDKGAYWVLKIEAAARRAFFCRSPPLWAMGVAHALQAIAHRVGSYKNNKICVIDINVAIQTSSDRIHKTHTDCPDGGSRSLALNYRHEESPTRREPCGALRVTDPGSSPG